jgi:hypothetical protein
MARSKFFISRFFYAYLENVHQSPVEILKFNIKYNHNLALDHVSCHICPVVSAIKHSSFLLSLIMVFEARLFTVIKLMRF